MATFTDDTLQRLSVIIAQSIVQAQGPMMTQILEGMARTTETKGRIDYKSIGAPPEWDSSKDDAMFLEWQIKLKA